MTNRPKIIDSHLHLDLIERHHPHRIGWLKENNCGVVSWAYFENIGSVPQLESSLQSKAQCIRKHSSEGLKCYYLIGVHPRSFPPDLKPNQIPSLLEPYLKDPLCRGIGEIGLETGNTREQEILITQLKLGRSIIKQAKVIGIHTPRSNKSAITEMTLDILQDFADIMPSLVIDHCTPDTIGPVLAAGSWAGVTLSPVKTSTDELKTIAVMFPDRLDRAMCNTDSGIEFYEDLANYRFSSDLPEELRKQMCCENAVRFFGVG